MRQMGEQSPHLPLPPPPPSWSPPPPPSDAVDAELAAAVADVVVRDKQGRMYVPLLPQYSCATAERYRCVLICRVVLCALAGAVLVLSVVGDVVPFCADGYFGYVGWSRYYYLWPSMGDSWMAADGELHSVIGLSMATIALSIICVALLSVFAAQWRTHERERRADEALCLRVCAHFGRPRPGQTVLPDDPLLYANQRVENRGVVASVPLEQRELRRRKRDWDMGVAIFSMLLVTAALALVVLVLMVTMCSSVADEFTASPGPALYGVAMGAALVSSIVIAIPEVANVLLCRAPRVERCMLMVAHEADEDDGDAAAALLLLQRLGLSRRALRGNTSGVGFGHDGANPLTSGVQHGIPMALPGPSGGHAGGAARRTAERAGAAGGRRGYATPGCAGGRWRVLQRRVLRAAAAALQRACCAVSRGTGCGERRA